MITSIVFKAAKAELKSFVQPEIKKFEELARTIATMPKIQPFATQLTSAIELLKAQQVKAEKLRNAYIDVEQASAIPPMMTALKQLTRKLITVNSYSLLLRKLR